MSSVWCFVSSGHHGPSGPLKPWWEASKQGKQQTAVQWGSLRIDVFWGYFDTMMRKYLIERIHGNCWNNLVTAMVLSLVIKPWCTISKWFKMQRMLEPFMHLVFQLWWWKRHRRLQQADCTVQGWQINTNQLSFPQIETHKSRPVPFGSELSSLAPSVKFCKFENVWCSKQIQLLDSSSAMQNDFQGVGEKLRFFTQKSSSEVRVFLFLSPVILKCHVCTWKEHV